MDQTDEPSLGLATPAPSKDDAYRVLARKYRPQDFTGLIGQDALVRTLSNAFATGRIAHAFMLTGVRGVGKTTTARIIARALNCIGPDGTRREPTIHPCGVCEPCVAIAEVPPCRRAGDGRRLAHRHRRRSRNHRGRALCAGLGALQGLHHRRSAHAVEAGLQRPPEDARRAAAACEVHFCDDRDPQGPGDRPVALPALRPEAHRDRRARRPSRRHCREGEREDRAARAGADRARGRGFGARRAFAARPGHRPGRCGRDRRRSACATCSASPTAAVFSISSRR